MKENKILDARVGALVADATLDTAIATNISFVAGNNPYTLFPGDEFIVDDTQYQRRVGTSLGNDNEPRTFNLDGLCNPAGRWTTFGVISKTDFEGKLSPKNSPEFTTLLTGKVLINEVMSALKGKKIRVTGKNTIQVPVGGGKPGLKDATQYSFETFV